MKYFIVKEKARKTHNVSTKYWVKTSTGTIPGVAIFGSMQKRLISKDRAKVESTYTRFQFGKKFQKIL